MQPQKYRSKLVTIEAMQLTRNVKERADIIAWIGEGGIEDKDSFDPVNLHIRNEHGIVVAEPGDWVIKGSRGEFYPCKDYTFVEKYEVLQPNPSTPAGANARK